MDQLRGDGVDVQPIAIEGRTIARSFWGKGWCHHLETFSDYQNRLPRGRTYVRNGSVCHLAIRPGQVDAIVSGSELYNVSVSITTIGPKAWRTINEKCAGGIGSMLELLRGRLSDRVMAVVTEPKTGLFPQPGELSYECDCPDWADMCKHVAAVLYGIGHRLDSRPELLFALRGVDAAELIATDLALPGDASAGPEAIGDDQISEIFGVDLDHGDGRGGDAAPRTSARPGRGAAKTAEKRPRGAGREGSAAASDGTKGRARKRGPVRGRGGDVRATSNGRPRIRPTGKSIARLRKDLGLSVNEFAQTLGVSPATVYRWESASGRLNLRSDTLIAIDQVNRRAKAS